jgi:hypothetical protein
MRRKTLFSAVAAILVLLVAGSEVKAWVAYRGVNVRMGGYNPYVYGGYHYGAYGGYRYGYARRW